MQARLCSSDFQFYFFKMTFFVFLSFWIAQCYMRFFFCSRFKTKDSDDDKIEDKDDKIFEKTRKISDECAICHCPQVLPPNSVVRRFRFCRKIQFSNSFSSEMRANLKNAISFAVELKMLPVFYAAPVAAPFKSFWNKKPVAQIASVDFMGKILRPVSVERAGQRLNHVFSADFF